MVTALNEMRDIERAIDSGTDDFLSKPVNKWELIIRVKTMLKIKDQAALQIDTVGRKIHPGRRFQRDFPQRTGSILSQV